MTPKNHVTSVTNESIAEHALEKIVLGVANDTKVNWAEPKDLYWFSEQEAKTLAPDLLDSAAKGSSTTRMPDDLAQMIDQYEGECAQAAIEVMPPEQLEQLRKPVRVALAEYAEEEHPMRLRHPALETTNSKEEQHNKPQYTVQQLRDSIDAAKRGRDLTDCEDLMTFAREIAADAGHIYRITDADLESYLDAQPTLDEQQKSAFVESARRYIETTPTFGESLQICLDCALDDVRAKATP